MIDVLYLHIHTLIYVYRSVESLEQLDDRARKANLPRICIYVYIYYIYVLYLLSIPDMFMYISINICMYIQLHI
jgi:hypothetical protein